MGRRSLAIVFFLAVLLGLVAAPAQARQLAGIQTHVLWGEVDDAEMRRQLDLVKASGAGIMRVDVGWASLQQGGPDGWSPWYLDKVDRMVAAADERGIRLLLTLMNTPCWASTAPESLKRGCEGEWWQRGVTAYPPADPRAYARALAFLVRRYGDRVEAWEVWNEPNHPDFWKASDQAAAYVRLLKPAYRAAKAADPRAYVIGGSLSLSDHEFTRRLYRLGAKGYFDAFAIHPYSDDASPLDPRGHTDARYSFVRGVQKVREVMQANGDRSPVWLTESGWSTGTIRTGESWRNGVSEAAQARFLREQAQQVARWPWVRANVWFNLLDAGSDREDKWSNLGLWRVDGTPKPAWTAFRDVAASLEADGRAAVRRGAARRAAAKRRAAKRANARRGSGYHRRA
jgi:hypothetical protein